MYVSPFEIFSKPIKIRPLKQLCVHRCLREWAVTTQQPLIVTSPVSIAKGRFYILKYKKIYNLK